MFEENSYETYYCIECSMKIYPTDTQSLYFSCDCDTNKWFCLDCLSNSPCWANKDGKSLHSTCAPPSWKKVKVTESYSLL